MAAKHSRHIALTARLAPWASERVAKGEYTSISDLVRTALRRLQDHHEAGAATQVSKNVMPGLRQQDA